jgi:hypothetical protein
LRNHADRIYRSRVLIGSCERNGTNDLSAFAALLVLAVLALARHQETTDYWCDWRFRQLSQKVFKTI